MNRSSKESANCYPLNQLLQSTHQEAIQHYTELLSEQTSIELSSSETQLIHRTKKHRR